MHSSNNVSSPVMSAAESIHFCHQLFNKTRENSKYKGTEAKRSSSTERQQKIARTLALSELKSSGICQQVKDCLEDQRTFTEGEINDLIFTLNQKTNFNNWKLEKINDQSRPRWIIFADHRGVQPGVIFNELDDCLKVHCFNYESDKHRQL